MRDYFQNSFVAVQLSLCLGLLLLSLGLPAPLPAKESVPPNAAPRYILFLTADGFRTDYVEWYNPTNIKQLIAEGVRVIHAKNVFPTVTTPNMTSAVPRPRAAVELVSDT